MNQLMEKNFNFLIFKKRGVKHFKKSRGLKYILCLLCSHGHHAAKARPRGSSNCKGGTGLLVKKCRFFSNSNKVFTIFLKKREKNLEKKKN